MRLKLLLRCILGLMWLVSLRQAGLIGAPPDFFHTIINARKIIVSLGRGDSWFGRGVLQRKKFVRWSCDNFVQKMRRTASGSRNFAMCSFVNRAG